jgi:hypothetical protein
MERAPIHYLIQIRFFYAFLRHGIRPRPIPQPRSPESYSLFLPIITSTHAPVLECDFNFHKSNSTYFTDLDVSRTHLISLLCSPGRAGYHERKRRGDEVGELNIALGGVACFFLKEIKPYEGYELWSRVLAWDRKWVYAVTHFVKKGAVRPDGVVATEKNSRWPFLAEIKKGKGQKTETVEEEGSVNGARKGDIFAFAISKYVFKIGRKTLPPELTFQRCGLLPPKPEDSAPSPPSSVEDSGLVENSFVDSGASTVLAGSASTSEDFEDLIRESIIPQQDVEKAWTWDMVEKERARGMEMARLMAGLDGLKMEYTGNSKPALGVY